MNFRFHHDFEKQLKKLSLSDRNQVKKRLLQFLEDPHHPQLNNHPLKGKYLDYRSINIRGDLRAIFKLLADSEAVFVAVGSHGKLYG